MRRHVLGASLGTVIALLGPGLAGNAPPATQQPESVFRVAADAVSVDVSVQRDRRPVANLRAADFEILDNGVPQEITDVTYETLPIDVTLLLDVSASVTGNLLDDLRRAVRQLRNDLRPGDRLRLLIFNMRVRRLVDFDQPESELDEALASLGGAGSSAVFDALAVALLAPEPPARRRLIVLFSDGQDSSSISAAETVLDVVGRSTSTVAIILGPGPQDRPASLLRVTPATVGAFSERIASESGGIVTTVPRGVTLSSQFRRMLQEFRASYVLHFTPHGVERAGAHTLEVNVKRSGVTVRARRGYVWR